MIVYKRKLTKDDILQLNMDEQLIYYYNYNIAFTINKVSSDYTIRKKLIHNDKLVEEHSVKTIDQVLKIVKN